MIFTRLGPEVPFYRALTPRWAYQPESGAGAAAVGGRFNRPGVDARYLAETAAGAIKEYQQESPLLSPSTLATYLVTADRIVDFSEGYTPEHWSPLWAEAYCNWKGLGVSGGHRATQLGHWRSRARRVRRRDLVSIGSRSRRAVSRPLP